MNDLINEKVARLFGIDVKNAKEPEVRLRCGFVEAWLSIFLNLLLFLAKLISGLLSASISVIADAVHSASDMVSSGVIIWGLAVSRRPADKEHPFGHGRMEDIAALIVSVLISVAGLEILLAAGRRFFSPAPIREAWPVLLVLVLSLFLKEFVTRFSLYLFKISGSLVLKADAWHHRSDVVSTVVVIAAVTGSARGIYRFDSLFGGLVALFIIITSIKLIRESITHLLGEGIDSELKKKIETLALSVPGVEDVYDVTAHDYGAAHKAISLRARVSFGLDPVRAHEIATRVETLIAREIPSSPIVHIDIKRRTRKEKKHIDRELDYVFSLYPEVLGFHAGRIETAGGSDRFSVHAVIPAKMPIQQAHELEHRLNNALAERFPGYRVDIHMEPCSQRCEQCLRKCPEAVR